MCDPKSNILNQYQIYWPESNNVDEAYVQQQKAPWRQLFEIIFPVYM